VLTPDNQNDILAMLGQPRPDRSPDPSRANDDKPQCPMSPP
jgi:hypothetical protein